MQETNRRSTDQNVVFMVAVLVVVIPAEHELKLKRDWQVEGFL